MKKFVLAILVTAIFALGLHAQPCYAQDSAKAIIRIKGEVAMAGLVNEWARRYMASNHGCSIVVSGSNPQEGFSALLDKSAEMFMVCQPMTAQDSSAAARRSIALAEPR